MRQRQRAVADIDVVKRIAHPGGLDLGACDLRVRKRLLEGLDHEVLGALVPMFSEGRASHAEDRDLVLDPACHVSTFEQGTLSRRRFPEIGSKAATLVARLDAKAHPHPVAHRKTPQVVVRELHHYPRAVVELCKPEPEWR